MDNLSYAAHMRMNILQKGVEPGDKLSVYNSIANKPH